MKTTQLKKALLLTLCMVLIVAMALFTTGCSTTTVQDEPEAITVSDGDTVGEGSTTFPLTIADKDGKEIQVEIKTDKTTVGDALVELGLIQGEEKEYGLYVKTVNGITADYDADGVYWAFYIDGEYALTGVDSTDITEGASYALRVEAG